MRKKMTERNNLVGRKEKENYSADFLNRAKSKRNNVKGITLIALIITIIVLLILAGVTINAITGNENVMEKAQQARSDNEEADELDSIKLAVVDAVAKGIDGKVSKDKLAESLEGLIDGGIEGGDTNPWTVKGKITGKKYTITENGNVSVDDVKVVNDKSGANKPNVNGLANVSYVTWTDDGSGTYTESVQTTAPSEWYDYENGKWANIKTTANDLEAYWVWIPRYEYKKPSSGSGAQQIDIKFIGTDKTTPDTDYIIHPAFTFGDKELEGIWVAKFEASSNAPNSIADGGGDTTEYKVQVKPNVPSWRSINTQNIFTVCKEMTNTGGVLAGSTKIDSHMMKNMEWGAVAILSQSQYGIFNPQSANKADKQVWNNPYYQYKKYAFDDTQDDDLDETIEVSDNDITKTGCAATSGGKDASKTTLCDDYNKGNGPKASTTGTVYGVYDMAGGSSEYVAGCLEDKVQEKFNPIEEKYVDLYTDSTGKEGDATTETQGWNGDFANFPTSSSPVFGRGSNYNSGTKAGVFSFGSSSGRRRL